MTGIEKEYRRAIIHALEESRDFLSRSNLDSIRRHTEAILQDQNIGWNDVIFLRTMKAIVEDGDIDLCSNIYAELSPSYKRKRADSLSQQMSIVVEIEPPVQDPTVNMSILDNNNNTAHTTHGHVCKEPPHRLTEYDKWKIIPKKVSDKAEKQRAIVSRK